MPSTVFFKRAIQHITHFIVGSEGYRDKVTDLVELSFCFLPSHDFGYFIERRWNESYLCKQCLIGCSANCQADKLTDFCNL